MVAPMNGDAFLALLAPLALTPPPPPRLCQIFDSVAFKAVWLLLKLGCIVFVGAAFFKVRERAGMPAQVSRPPRHTGAPAWPRLHHPPAAAQPRGITSGAAPQTLVSQRCRQQLYGPENDELGLGWVEAFYFGMVTATSIGYGDITPTTNAGRGFLIVYMLVPPTSLAFHCRFLTPPTSCEKVPTLANAPMRAHTNLLLLSAGVHRGHGGGAGRVH